MLTEEFVIAGVRFVKYGNGPWYRVLGFGLCSGGKYYGWNSFATQPYKTRKTNAEIFPSKDSAEKFMKKYSLLAEIIMMIWPEDPGNYFRECLARRSTNA